MKPSRVHILGASGSGTTTLARALATRWSVPHADTDDYFWLPTDPPYRENRSPSERLALMQALFVPRAAWVLSGSLLGWGESIAEGGDAMVFLTLDPTERHQRLEERENVRAPGVAVDDPERVGFLEWAASYDDPECSGRSRAAHERWLATVTLPVLRLDSARPVDELVEAIVRWTPEQAGPRDEAAGRGRSVE